MLLCVLCQRTQHSRRNAERRHAGGLPLPSFAFCRANGVDRQEGQTHKAGRRDEQVERSHPPGTERKLHHDMHAAAGPTAARNIWPTKQLCRGQALAPAYTSLPVWSLNEIQKF
jgi:hypothetical protein